MHFKTPGEHRINGRKYDMEIQILCQTNTYAANQKMFVVAFMGYQGTGGENKFLDMLVLINLRDSQTPRAQLVDRYS